MNVTNIYVTRNIISRQALAYVDLDVILYTFYE